MQRLMGRQLDRLAELVVAVIVVVVAELAVKVASMDAEVDRMERIHSRGTDRCRALVGHQKPEEHFCECNNIRLKTNFKVEKGLILHTHRSQDLRKGDTCYGFVEERIFGTVDIVRMVVVDRTQDHHIHSLVVQRKVILHFNNTHVH